MCIPNISKCISAGTSLRGLQLADLAMIFSLSAEIVAKSGRMLSKHAVGS